ncbi:MAG: LPP20 family lipoprotein [Nitrospira sp.]|nr:LPP20 family lipoprotein [Nitrospira sp.]
MQDRNHRLAKIGVALVLVMGGLSGCESTPTGEEMGGTRRALPIQDVDGPEWITKNGAAFNDEKHVFYGVGNAAGIQNPALRRRSAEAAARRFLAENFQVYVAGLNKQYLAETTAGDMERASVEQHVEDVMKQVTDATLVGTKMIEYWEHPDRNEAYALAKLDLDEFLEAMQKYGATVNEFKELDATMREFIRKNARKAHEELNKELKKQ